jgi:PAS domain S-box-containing protein
MHAWIQSLVQPNKREDLNDQRLVLIVLGISLLMTVLFYLIGASPALMLPLSFLLLLALLLALRGYVRLAGLFGPTVALIVFARLICENFGIRDTAILGLPAVIIAASLMNGRQGVLIFGGLSLSIVTFLGLSEANGGFINRAGIRNTPTDYLVVCAVIILTIALQWAVIERLRESANRAHRALAERQQAEDALRQSEERYRLISEVSSDYVFSSRVGRDGNMTTEWIAGAFESISGYTTEEFIARGGWRATLHPDDLAQDEQDMVKLRANQKVTSELRVVTKEGAIRWVRIFARPIWDSAENRLVGVHGAAQNITAQKATENALRESQERYRTFIAQSTEGIRRYDFPEPISIDLPEDEQVRRMLAEMYIGECNDTFARMYGLDDASQLVGKRLADLHLEQDPANLAGFHAFIRSGYKITDAETHEIDFQGRERYYLVSTIGIVENGCLVRAWGIQQDITERKHAEDEIRRLNEQLELRVARRTSQLEAANRELEAFSYSISHDLRAPLRAINGFTRILVEDFSEGLDPAAINYMRRVQSSAVKMGQLIDELLQFSRVSRQEMKQEPVDLARLIPEVFAELREGHPDERQIDLTIEPLPCVPGDLSLLKQVFVNLLGNAIKYTRNRSQARIEVGVQMQNGEEVFFVRDNGAGFDMRYAERLFGVFQRLHREEEFEGTGVGLAIVDRIIQKHGGRIWAEAAVDQGATFYFTLER